VRNKKLLTPHEAEIDRLLQIMAVLIDKLGGEVVLNRQEMEAYFDATVVTRVISPDYILLRVNPDETSEAVDIDLPEETPQI
jgi:NAD(P)H-hydrate repair Nnr-like enzyme with NAD(P)H-hydrate dehydratase domain